MDTSMKSRIVVALAIAAGLGFATDDAAGDESKRYFRCELNGTMTFSDTACDAVPGKVAINVDRLNTYEPTEVLSRPANRVNYNAESIADNEPRESPSASIAEEQMKHKQRCKEIAERLDAITEQMRRAGSGRGSVDRMNRLREREREIEDRKRAEKCD